MIYAVSDSHGQYDTFITGLDRINFGEEDQLYVIGDVIDRGSGGIKLLQYIRDHKNMDLLIGNHELMMLNSVDPDGKPECNGEDTTIWVARNGGGMTFMNYTRLEQKERLSILKWMRERCVIKTLDVNGKSFCLTHSYFNPEFADKRYSEISYKDTWDIVWKSIFRHDSMTYGNNIYPRYDYTFITGHVPVQIVMDEYAGYNNPNRLKSYKRGNLINIDGGCGLGSIDKLKNGAIFFRLDDMKEFAVRLVT